ncbi:MAG TPA: hypothetical protein VHG28_02620 [Longimicrobiaceae bacterium]|nr:hypothetical protein [Longimicrobiaceae bacterium]
MSPNRTETFRYNMAFSPGSFVLMGRPPDGDDRRSTLRGGGRVIWDVQLNSIRVRDQG